MDSRPALILSYLARFWAALRAMRGPFLVTFLICEIFPTFPPMLLMFSDVPSQTSVGSEYGEYVCLWQYLHWPQLTRQHGPMPRRSSQTLGSGLSSLC